MNRANLLLQKLEVRNKDSHLKEAKDIVTVVNVKLTTLGVPSKLRLKNETNGKVEVLGSVRIDPKDLGLFAPVISSLELAVYAGTETTDKGEFAQIRLEYSYYHPNKRKNGYTARLYWDGNKRHWEDRS